MNGWRLRRCDDPAGADGEVGDGGPAAARRRPVAARPEVELGLGAEGGQGGGGGE